MPLRDPERAIVLPTVLASCPMPDPIAARRHRSPFMLHKFFIPALCVLAGVALARPAAPQ